MADWIIPQYWSQLDEHPLEDDRLAIIRQFTTTTRCYCNHIVLLSCSAATDSFVCGDGAIPRTKGIL